MISSTNRKAGPYAGDSLTTVFPFTFKVFKPEEVQVVLADVLGNETTLTVGYAVALNTNQDSAPGGTVTLASPLAVGSRLVLASAVLATQPMQLTNGGGFFPRVLNDSADRITIILQQISERFNRALVAPITSDEPVNGLQLPSASARAGKFVAFDALGRLVPAAPSPGTDAAIRADLGSSTGSGLIGWLQAGVGAVSRAIRDKLRERLSPRDFGAVGDGTTDDTVALQKLATYVNGLPAGAKVYLGAGSYRFTSNLTFTSPVTFIGDGSRVSAFVMYNNARLILDGNRMTQPEFAMYELSILTDGIHATSPVVVDYSPHSDGLLSHTFTARNVVFAGRNSMSGYAIGLAMVDCPWPTLDNVVFIGDYGRGGAALSGFGVKYTGQDGSAMFARCRFYFLADGLWMEGEMEGDVVTRCEFVACQRGITAKDTTNGLQPLLIIRDNHLNCEEYNISILGIDQFTIAGNDMYCNGFKAVAATHTMVDITPTTAVGGDNSIICSGQIVGNTFNGDGGYAANKIGIRVRGVASAVEKYRIYGNHYQGLSTARQFDALTNGVQVDETTEVFINVAMPYVDNGVNNYRQPRTMAGSTVATTSAGGILAIPFGSALAFSVAPVVVVSGGDSSGAGETYTVVAGSVTAIGFSALVSNSAGPLAAGNARRVNWIAAGSN